MKKENNITNQTFAIRCQHSDSYYLQQLKALLSGLAAGHNDRAMADHMNAAGLLSATGKPWTAPAVHGALHKLRSAQTTSSYLHQALMRLVFDNLLTKTQVLPLLESRNSPALRM